MGSCIYINKNDKEILEELGLSNYDTEFASDMIAALCGRLKVDPRYWEYKPIKEKFRSIMNEFEGMDITEGEFREKIRNVKRFTNFEYMKYCVYVFKQNAERDENFDKNHKYLVRGKEAVRTMSNIDAFAGDGNNGEKSEWAKNGEKFDRYARGFLSGKKMISDARIPTITRRNMREFKRLVENAGGKFITNEYTISLIYGNKARDLIAGTPDCIIVWNAEDESDKKTHISIVDFKVKSFDITSKTEKSEEDRLKYRKQLELYKKGYMSNFDNVIVDDIFLLIANAERNGSKELVPIFDKTRDNGEFPTGWRDFLYNMNSVESEKYSNNGALMITNSKRVIEAVTEISDLEIGRYIDNIFREFEERHPKEDKPELIESNEDNTDKKDSDIQKNKNYQSEILESGRLTYQEIIDISENCAKDVIRRIRDIIYNVTPPEDYGISISESLSGMTVGEVANKYKNLFLSVVNVTKEQFWHIPGMDNEKYDYIYNNFYKILAYANSVFLSSAGIKVNIDGSSLISDIVIEEDEEGNPFNVEIKEESFKESDLFDWKDPSYELMDPEIKSLLSTIEDYKYDDNGDVKMDEYWNIEYNESKCGFKDIHTYKNASEVIYFLLDNLHSCETIDEMDEKMIEISDTKGGEWVRILSNQLSLGENLWTKFFNTMRRAECKFVKVYSDKNGVFTVRDLSISNKVDTIMDGVVNKVIMKRHDKGYKPDTILYSMKSDPIGFVRVDEKLSEEFPVLNSVDNTIKALRILGFSDIDSEIILRQNKKKYKYVKDNINHAIEVLYNAIGRAESYININKTKCANFTGKYSKGEIVNDKISIERAYNMLAMAVEPLYTYKAEATMFDGVTSHPAFSDISYMKKLFDRLSKKDKEYIIKEYSNPSFMLNNGGGFFNPILKRLNNAEGENFKDLQSTIGYVSATLMDDKKYMEQTDEEFALNCILTYFSKRGKYAEKKFFGTGKNMKAANIGRFKMPIFSDKGELGFFEFAIDDDHIFKNEKSEQNAKDIITDEMFEFVRAELDRIKYVVDNARKGTQTSVERFDIVNKDILKKLKNKEIVESDVFENGKMKNAFKQSGASFKYFDMFNEYIARDSKARKNFVKLVNGENVTASEFRDIFNTSFRKFMEEESSKFKKMIGMSVRDDDKNSFQKSISESILAMSEDVEYSNLERMVDEFLWNSYIMSASIINLTVVDPAYFKDIVDFQKRYAQVYSQTRKVDTLKESYIVNENDNDKGEKKLISDGKHRVIIIEDPRMSSELADSVGKVFDDLISKYSTGSASDKKKAEEYRNIKKLAINILSEESLIPDGQGYGSPTGFWKKVEMLGESNEEFNKAMGRIRLKKYNIGDFETVIQSFKPFIFTHIDVNGRKVPMQVKDSETMIMLAGVIGGQPELTALYNFLEDSHYGFNEKHNRDTYVENGIDVAVMHSAVKNGANNVIHIPELTEEELEKMKNMSDSEKSKFLKDFEDRVYNHLKESCVTKEGYTKCVIAHDFEDWGKQQENPAHMQNGNQPMGSQIRILEVADLDDEFEFRGKMWKRDDFIREYFGLINNDMSFGLNEMLDNLYMDNCYSIKDRKAFNKMISDMCRKAVKSDQKFTIELYNAFELDSEGNFRVPMGDIELSTEMFKVIFSTIKKNVNNEYMSGGPVVQESPFGGCHRELKARDINGIAYGEKGFDPSKGVVYDVYTVAPTTEIEDKITYNSKNKFFKGKGLGEKYRDGEIISMDDIMRLGILSEDELRMICYRIPTEDTYSMFRCKIKGFLPRQKGETIIMPFEVPVLSGTDFDIDKMYCMFKYKIDESSDKKDRLKIKNEIFDMQWDIQSIKTNVAKHFHPGNFEILKNLGRELSVNDKARDINSFMTQIELRSRNKAGNQFVGIAASNNVAHSVSNMANIEMVADERLFGNEVSINEVNISDFVGSNGLIKADPTYSIIDGSRISRTVGMFVGASADNAKEAVLGAVNINPTNANIAMAMMRMGFPLNFVVYAMNTPLIKEICLDSERNGSRFEKAIMERYYELFDEAGKLKSDDKKINAVDPLNKMSFNTDRLRGICRRESNKTTIEEYALLKMMAVMAGYAGAYQQMNTVISKNSMKNSVGPNQYEAIKEEYKIFGFIENPNQMFYSDSEKGDSPAIRIFKSVPFLKTLCDTYTDVVPSIGRYISPMYDSMNGGFKNFLQYISIKYNVNIQSMDARKMKRLYSDFIVFRAANAKRADGSTIVDGSVRGMKKLYDEFPEDIIKGLEALADETNSLMNNLSVENKGGKNMLKINSLVGDTMMKNEIIASWDIIHRTKSMDIDKVMQAQRLSKKLLEYAVRTRGIEWELMSILNFAPNSVKTDSRMYRNMFGDANMSEELYDAFVMMNMRNRQDSIFFKRLYRNSGASVKSGKLMIPVNGDVGSMINNGTAPAGFIMYKDRFIPKYDSGKIAKTTIEEKEYYVYEKINNLGCKGVIEYPTVNPNVSVATMKSVFDSESRIDAKSLVKKIVEYGNGKDVTFSGEEVEHIIGMSDKDISGFAKGKKNKDLIIETLNDIRENGFKKDRDIVDAEEGLVDEIEKERSNGGTSHISKSNNEDANEALGISEESKDDIKKDICKH